MKVLARVLGFISATVICASAVVVPTAASAAEIETKTAKIHRYESVDFYYTYAKQHNFKVKITNNKNKYLDAKLSFDDAENGSSFELQVTGLKKTPRKNAPIIKVYYKNQKGKSVVIAKARVKVSGKMIKQSFKNVTLNPGTVKPAQKLKGYYPNCEEIVSDESVFEFGADSPYITNDIFNGESSLKDYIKGVKKGTATVSYLLKGYNVKLGEYKVTVKDVKTTIKKKYKTINLNYSDSKKCDKNQFYTALILNNYHAGAVYTTKISDGSVLSAKTVKKGKISPNTNELLTAKKVGETKVTVYEQKNGSSKKTKVGTVSVKVSTCPQTP